MSGASTSTHERDQDFAIRPAVDHDLPAIHAIYRNYVLNTTIAFLLNDPPLEYIKKRYDAAQSHGLPYLVAVAPLASDSEEKVLGYAHASPFSGDKAGCAPSVEITIFCDPACVSRGVGGALIRQLLADLKTCRNTNWEAGHEEQAFDTPVRNVFAIVSQDVERRGEGSGQPRDEEIVKWYCERFGFRVVGRMEKVGFKFGHDIDVMYLQKQLL